MAKSKAFLRRGGAVDAPDSGRVRAYTSGGPTRRRRPKSFARRSADVCRREDCRTRRARRRAGRHGEVRRAQGPHHRTALFRRFEYKRNGRCARRLDRHDRPRDAAGARVAAPRNGDLTAMNPERWRRIEELFGAVVDRPVAERDAYLTRVCYGDEDLQREVLSLLDRDTAKDFIRDPIASVALSFTAKSKEDLTGERVGPYRILRMVGRGGMGDVYEAERDDEQFRQQVAIKIIKRGMDTEFVRDRFLRERQILASLDHPHIARLYDGGATTEGLPYFVMEFVAGDRITAYCHRHQLSINEKLKLFRRVCSAVQHAHQKLVVHRDLKPSNILITEDGMPKLLDFGIAKMLSPDVSESHTRTDTALRLMTPEYASPEQARGQAVATTTDV